MVTTLPSHEVKLGTTTVQTLNGGDAMDPQAESSVAATASSGSSAEPVNNGPGVTKGPASQGSVPVPVPVSVTVPVPTPTVIQTSLGAGTGVVIPAMQTSLTINGGNNNNNNTTTGGASQPVASKSEAPKAVVQTLLQSSPGAVKGAVLAGAVRSGAPVSAAVASVVTAGGTTAGIRTIAPQQVLAPRLPLTQNAPGQPNIQNIQLPPGMVLVRSETGQLLMIPQQVLAQMQAQMQASRAATPASTTPGQITSAQTPGAPIMTRQVAPALIKQGSPTASTATTSLQRPPVQTPAVGSVLAVQPSAAPRVVTPATGTSITMGTETMENVKKCKNFLSTLIKLATSAKQSSQTAANVKLLVKNLLEGTIEAEDFTSRLYKELNSSPQPYLVPFLKRSLPALRQLTPDSLAFIQQSQGLQAKPATTVALPVPTAANATVAIAAAPAATAAVATAPTTSIPTPAAVSAPTTAPRTLIQSTISKPGQPASLVLQSTQQGAIVKSPQVTLTTTPMVTLRGQPHSRIVVGQSPVQLKQIQTVAVRPGVVSASKISPSPVTLTAAQKSKLNDAAGGTFKDDDDINDVASMAGVNLSEESARILATNSELVGAVTRSCKDEAFLSSSSLQRRILDIGKRYGVTELGPEVANLVSHATQQRLQNLLEKVSIIAQQKNMTYKEDGRFEQVTDVRSQLKFFEQLDQLEKQKKEEQEREILMKAAKSRSRQEDPEQLRLKQKAKEMQQQELAQIRQRDANLTALAAIGPRRKRKLDSFALGTDAEGSGSSASASAGLSSGTSRQFTRQRITRVNLRDLLFCLENERTSSRSQLLYRALLK